MRIFEFFIFILLFLAPHLYAPHEPDSRENSILRVIYSIFPPIELLQMDWECLFNALASVHLGEEIEDPLIQPIIPPRGQLLTLVTIKPAEPA